MKLIKMTMVCILLAPTLCWGGKFDSLLGALSHARAPLVVRVPQAGLDLMNLQGRQYHGSAALCVRHSPTELDWDPMRLEMERNNYERKRLEALEKMGIRVVPSKTGSQELAIESTSSSFNPGQMNVCKGCLELKAEYQSLKKKLADSGAELSDLAKVELVKGERLERRVNYGLMLFALLVGAGFMNVGGPE